MNDLPTQRLVKEVDMGDPEMQTMMDDIAAVLNSKYDIESHFGKFFEFFQVMIEFGFRRIKDAKLPTNQKYFEWLYNELVKDAGPSEQAPDRPQTDTAKVENQE